MPACIFEVGKIKLTICRYVAISVFFCAMKVGAQTQTVSTSALVNMKVKSTSSLTVNRDLSMGVVIQSATSLTVDPINGGNSAAYFSLSAPPNTPVTVTFSSTPLTDGVNSILFSGTLAGSNGTVQSQATLLSNGSAATTSPTGSYYFWAGGRAIL